MFELYDKLVGKVEVIWSQGQRLESLHPAVTAIDDEEDVFANCDEESQEISLPSKRNVEVIVISDSEDSEGLEDEADQEPALPRSQEFVTGWNTVDCEARLFGSQGRKRTYAQAQQDDWEDLSQPRRASFSESQTQLPFDQLPTLMLTPVPLFDEEVKEPEKPRDLGDLGDLEDLELTQIDPGMIVDPELTQIDPGMIVDPELTQIDPGMIGDPELTQIDPTMAQHVATPRDVLSAVALQRRVPPLLFLRRMLQERREQAAKVDNGIHIEDPFPAALITVPPFTGITASGSLEF